LIFLNRNYPSLRASQLSASTAPKGSVASVSVNVAVSARGSVRVASRLSDMEHAILNSAEPVVLEETEMIRVNGQEGWWCFCFVCDLYWLMGYTHTLEREKSSLHAFHFFHFITFSGKVKK
jgi:hypothetical protein